MSNLHGKVIVLTGAASGIGYATARLLAGKGAKLSLADLQEGPLELLTRELTQAGGTVMATALDVRNRKSVEDWIERTVEVFGGIDGAANLAGVIGKQIHIASVSEIDDDDWDFVLDVNLKGLLNCLRAQIPRMNAGASIVNAASVAGISGFSRNAAYVASKHAVVGLTRTVAKEEGHRQIRCNAICPGPIKTAMLQKSANVQGEETDTSQVPLNRAGEVEEAANLIEWLLSPGSSYISGTTQVIDGGWVC